MTNIHIFIFIEMIIMSNCFEYKCLNSTSCARKGVCLNETHCLCNKGYITHRTGSGLINLKGATNTCKAKYRVEFNGNIAVPNGGTASAISLAIAIEGEPDLSTLAISTPTATEAFNNVSMATDVWLPCGCCQAVSVKNTSAQAISVANASITVNRIG